MTTQSTYDQGAAVAGRLRAFSDALAADAWALEEALRAYRAGPDAAARDAAARRIDEQVGFIRAEVFGIEQGEPE